MGLPAFQVAERVKHMQRKQFLGTASAAAITAATPAFARAQNGNGYTIEGSFDLGAQGAVRSIRFAPERGIVPVRCLAAMLPRAAFSATLIELQERSTSYTAVADLGRSNNAAVAINGGFFKYDTFSPDGLLIVNGRRVGQMRTDVGGVAMIDDKGAVTIGEDVPPGAAPRFALQGIPMLVLPDGKMAMRSENGMRARRSFLAQSDDVVIAGITSPVTLWHLADVMIEYPDAFGVDRIDGAINLTGDATSAFYAKLADGTTMERTASWPNLDVLLFVRRSGK